MTGTPDSSITIYGSWHLAGATVGVSIAGVYMGTATVATDGSVTVLYGSDTSGKITAAYLTANFTSGIGSDQDTTFSVYDGTNIVSVTVPVLVGLLYTGTGRTIRPMTAEAGGVGLGNMRRAHRAAILTPEAHIDLQVGTSTSDLHTVTLTTDSGLTPELALADDQPFSGVVVTPVVDGHSFDTQFVWQSAEPYRLSIAAVTVFRVDANE